MSRMHECCGIHASCVCVWASIGALRASMGTPVRTRVLEYLDHQFRSSRARLIWYSMGRKECQNNVDTTTMKVPSVNKEDVCHELPRTRVRGAHTTQTGFALDSFLPLLFCGRSFFSVLLFIVQCRSFQSTFAGCLSSCESTPMVRDHFKQLARQ